MAAATDAMRRSAKRERALRPAARVAAKIRPYIRAASASKGSGLQVEAAHCSLSCRLALSFSSSVACGPADSSARVTEEIADSSGSSDASSRSWSMRTEVSRSPLVGSAIYGVIHYCVDIRTKPIAVDSRSSCRGISNGCSRNEPSRRNRPELGDRHAVARDDDSLTRLHFPQNSP